MSIFNRDSENEVSGGQVFGFALLGFAILFIICFGIFVGINKLNGGSDSAPAETVTEQTVETDVAAE